MDWRGWLYCSCLVVFLCLLGVSFRAASSRDDRLIEAKKHFQQQIGGVGMGSIIAPAWNFRDFDPRLQPVANDELYPLPGGYSYSPDRLSMVSSFSTPPVP